ncbi:MAG: adenylate/guanylate cyclase domain-containing protein [Cyanobacteriota bacterium]|nr:adenylate/guanylate cyclase domain-containing protein [Cyanobacteriota bacterium]
MTWRIPWIIGTGLGMGALMATLSLHPLLGYPLTLIEEVLTSQFFLWRGSRDPHPDVVILALDEDSLRLRDLFEPEELQDQPELQAMARGVPWPRQVFASAVQKLTDAGASRIGFDILFDEPSFFGEADDQVFGDAVAAFPGKTVFAVTDTFISSTLSSGLYNIRVEPTLIEALQRERVELGLVHFYPASHQQLLRIPGRHTLANRTTTDIPPFSLVTTGDPVPEQDIGINYAGTTGSYPTYSFWMLFDPFFWQTNLENGAVFRGKTVLIGSTALLAQDLWPTPFTPQMPGVEIHAHAIGTLLGRQGLRSLPTAYQLVLVGMTGLLTGLSLFGVKRLGMKLLLATTGLTLGIGLGYWSFLALWILPMGGILTSIGLTGLVDITATGLREQRQRQQLRRILDRRVAASVLQEILAQPQAFADSLGGRRCQVAVLFSDIRSFTTLSSQISPETLVTLLNRYFACMVEPILQQKGVVDKFIGDAVMAEFGCPIFRDAATEALASVRAALQMRRSLLGLREQLRQEQQPLIFHGIGINFGEVIAGNLGSPEKIEYTVIGDAVNVASRIEGMTKDLGHDILISQAVYQLVQDQIEAVNLGSIYLKGKPDPVVLYGVIDEKGGSGQTHRQVQQDYQAWSQKMIGDPVPPFPAEPVKGIPQ